MIHVGFGTSNLYAKLAGTMMLSLLENHIPPPKRLPSITVHILHDSTLTNDNREKFSWLAGQYGQAVKFYNVEELCADKINLIKEAVPAIVKNTRYTMATFYRILAPYLFSENTDKYIFLDADIIVNLDIKELWQIELGDKVLAVVTEFSNYKSVENMKAWNPIIREETMKIEDYFNAGVMLINVKSFRAEEETMIRGVKFLGEHPYYKYFDQEVLNYCFSTRTLKLPTKFNRLIKAARDDNEVIVEKKIYHYANTELQLEINDPFNRLWMSYFIKTPWFDENTIGRLYAGVQELHVGLKQSMIQISAMMSGKTRAFFVAPGDVDTVKEIFSVRKDEEIIRAESEASLKKLINAMKKSRGKKVFFIMLPIFPFQELIDAGFEAGKDFVNGVEFLSEAHGMPFNSFPLILAM